MAWVSGLWGFLRVLWHTVLGDLVVRAAHHILTTVGRSEVNQLAELAREKVAEVEERWPEGDGQLKHDEVLRYLQDYATAQGLKVTASVLNFVIEAAVAALARPS